MLYNAPCSAGDLVDRITILEIKVKRLPPDKSAAAQEELALLQECAGDLPIGFRVFRHYEALQNVNAQLWDIEDRVRALHRAQRYDEEFIETCKPIAPLNDERARLKRVINRAVGSTIVEMKSHF